MVLNFDGIDDSVHVRQERRFLHGYYAPYCFLSLYVFCGDRLLGAYSRQADGAPVWHTGAILKLLVRRLRQAWPSVRIIAWGGSAFCGRSRNHPG